MTAISSENPIAAMVSMNFMWVNKTAIPSDQEFLLRNQFETRVIEPLTKWAKLNPNFQINFWYDGELAPHEAIARSSRAVLDRWPQNSTTALIFNDVRNLEGVRAFPDICSTEIPIYHRVDLLRAIITEETLRKAESQLIFVYSDLDIEPKVLQEKDLSSRFGFVMAETHTGEVLTYENSFQAFDNRHPETLQIFKKVVIDPHVLAIRERRKILDNYAIQSIYRSYGDFFKELTRLSEGREVQEQALLFSQKHKKNLDSPTELRKLPYYGAYVNWNKENWHPLDATELHDSFPLIQIESPISQFATAAQSGFISSSAQDNE